MPHNHMMYDTDKRLTIDVTTRSIQYKDKDRPSLVQYDHNSEFVSFKIGRFVEGHDLSLCDKVEIHYVNSSSSGAGSNKDVYLVSDLRVDPDDNNKLLFTWVVAESATMYVGSLKFVISFSCTEDGELLYRWNTVVNTGINILPGINNGEYVDQSYSDILETWRLSLFGTGDTVEAAIMAMAEEQMQALELKAEQTLATIPDEYVDLQEEVAALAEERYIPQTTYSDDIITEVYEDGHYKVTEFSGNIITEKWYTSSDVLTKTKTITVSQNGVSESITLPT